MEIDSAVFWTSNLDSISELIVRVELSDLAIVGVGIDSTCALVHTKGVPELTVHSHLNQLIGVSGPTFLTMIHVSQVSKVVWVQDSKECVVSSAPEVRPYEDYQVFSVFIVLNSSHVSFVTWADAKVSLLVDNSIRRVQLRDYW